MVLTNMVIKEIARSLGLTFNLVIDWNDLVRLQLSYESTFVFKEECFGLRISNKNSL